MYRILIATILIALFLAFTFGYYKDAMGVLTVEESNYSKEEEQHKQ